jgi:hypothetical protein
MSGWRVAVLGNSHAAALGLGWKAAGGDIAGIASLSVFARPNGQGGLDGLRLKGGAWNCAKALCRLPASITSNCSVTTPS